MNTHKTITPILRGSENPAFLVLINCGLAAAYVATGKFGLSLAFFNESATAVWPPTGIALAAVLLLGNAVWPGIWVGAFLVNLTTSGLILSSAGIATGNTLEAIVAAWAAARLANGVHAFDDVRNTLRFLLFAAILSTMISATFGVASLTLDGLATWSQIPLVWLTWWCGDMVSAVVVAPLILIWITAAPPRVTRARAGEAALLIALLLLSGLVVFGRLLNAPLDRYPLAFVCFPPLLWAAFRFGPRGAITSAFALSAIAISGTLNGLGPFRLSHPNESLLVLQAFLGTVTVTGLVLAALVAERERGAATVQVSQSEALAQLAQAQAAEQRMACNLAVAIILAEAPRAGEALLRVLQTVCETLRWEVGAIWAPSLDGTVLRCLQVWHDPNARVEKFKAVTEARTFLPGVGLPGRVWSSRKPAWILDVTKDENFPRAPYAVAEGLHGAFGFPILAGDRCVAVMEFFSREIREPDNALLAMFGVIGGQIGQFVKRQSAEEALRESEVRKSAILESALDSIITMDSEGMIVDFNPAAARTFGYTSEQAVGRPVAEMIVPPRLRAAHRAGLARFHATGEGPVLGRRLEMTALRADGSEFPIELAITSTRTDGHPVFFTAYLRDITERKRAEDALLEADRRKDEFLAILAHELRNPLAPIRTALALLHRIAQPDAETRELYEIIDRQVGQMARLLDDLLDVSRITTGKIQLRREVITLGTVLSSALESSRPLIEGQGHELIVSIPATPIHLDADLTRLSQVFSNLLNNAGKYTEKGGKIWVTAERFADEVVVRVRDTGIGIAPGKLPHIFDVFVQADNALERTHGGLGIGLALARRLLNMHGGRIEARSEGVGRGSEFIVRLPVIEQVPGETQSAAPPEGAPPAKPLRIVVADDNVSAADLIAKSLRSSGHDTRTAYDGSAALELISSFRPDVALLDIGMPKMNGYEVARRIRASEGGERMLVVALTGWGQESDKRRAMDAGFNEHLTKPVDLRAIESLLARCNGERTASSSSAAAGDPSPPGPRRSGSNLR